MAQHFRDARIAPIYEGTNGIQAIDLVTRKLPLEGGAAIAGFLADVMDTTRALTEAKDEKLAFIGRGLADAHAVLAPTTTWLQDKLKASPSDALAGATPYLKLFGTVAGAHFLGVAALHAARKQAEIGRLALLRRAHRARAFLCGECAAAFGGPCRIGHGGHGRSCRARRALRLRVEARADDNDGRRTGVGKSRTGGGSTIPSGRRPSPGDDARGGAGRDVGEAAAALPARPHQCLAHRGAGRLHRRRHRHRRARMREVWENMFASVMRGRPVGASSSRISIPITSGLAGWLCEKFDVPLIISRTEYLLCRTMVADTGREAPPEGIRFYKAAGFSEEALERYRKRFGFFGSAVHRLPQSYRRIEEGAAPLDRRTRMAGDRRPRPFARACLPLLPALNIVISGDQILPRISSNVSVHPTEPEANPLGDWLSSCARLKSVLPADILVLPSHNEPFHGAHIRLDALIRGHEAALGETCAICAGRPSARSMSSARFFSVGFRRPPPSWRRAKASPILTISSRRDAVRRERDMNGVDWYRTVA